MLRGCLLQAPPCCVSQPSPFPALQWPPFSPPRPCRCSFFNPTPLCLTSSRQTSIMSSWRRGLAERSRWSRLVKNATCSRSSKSDSTAFVAFGTNLHGPLETVADQCLKAFCERLCKKKLSMAAEGGGTWWTSLQVRQNSEKSSGWA